MAALFLCCHSSAILISKKVTSVLVLFGIFGGLFISFLFV